MVYHTCDTACDIFTPPAPPPSSITCRLDSLKPEDYPRLPLPLFKTDRTAPEKCVLLSQVFWLLLDDAFSWQSMSRLSCQTMEEVERLAESQHLSISASKSGAALKAIPKISKHLVAYMAGLVAVSPYTNGPFDSRTKGVAEHAATEALCLFEIPIVLPSFPDGKASFQQLQQFHRTPYYIVGTIS